MSDNQSRRDPITVLSDMKTAFNEAQGSRARVLAIRDAMLTPAERLAVAGVEEPDRRTNIDLDFIAATVDKLLADCMYKAPELFFGDTHMRIGNLVLRQCEIAAICDLRAS